jgi:hypothetical protein
MKRKQHLLQFAYVVRKMRMRKTQEQKMFELNEKKIAMMHYEMMMKQRNLQM